MKRISPKNRIIESLIYNSSEDLREKEVEKNNNIKKERL